MSACIHAQNVTLNLQTLTKTLKCK